MKSHLLFWAAQGPGKTNHMFCCPQLCKGSPGEKAGLAAQDGHLATLSGLTRA